MTIESKSLRPGLRAGWRRGLQAGVLGLGLLGAIVVVPGCFGGDGGGPPPPAPVCDDGAIRLMWDLSENGQTVECAQGDEVDVTVDSMVVTFACADHVDTTPLIAGGVAHSVSLQLYDAGNVLLSQTGVMNIPVGCDQTAVAQSVDFSLTP